MILAKDTLQELERICKGGMPPAPLTIAGRDDLVWVRTAAGEMVQQQIPLPPAKLRAYQATSVAGLCQMVAHLAPGTKDKGGVAVFVGAGPDGGGKIVAVLGEGERRETIGMDLVPHPAMLKLMEWEKGEGTNLEQRELIWAIRTTFGLAVQPASFLPGLRNVKFRASSEAAGTVEHGRESMGKSVEAAMVEGVDKLAEELQIRMPVYANVREEAGPPGCVVCQFDILPGKQRFVVKPWAGEVTARREIANRAIADAIRKILKDGGVEAVVFECAQFQVRS